MSKATLLYMKERPVNSESQTSQSNPRSHNSAGAVGKEQKRPDSRSNSDMPMPSSRDSAKPNVNTGSRGQLLDGSAEADRLGIHTPSHSPPPERPVHDEGGVAANSSAKEHNVDITGNKVMALRARRQFRRQNKLITGSNHRTTMGIFGATFAHIYYMIRTSPSQLRSSIDALQEVGLFRLYHYAKSLCLFRNVAPGHYHVNQYPQDVAWLSAMRYAKRSVFMFVLPLL